MSGIWDQYGGTAPATPEDKPWYSDAYEVGRQVGAGAAVDLPRMVGQGLRWVSRDGSSLDDTGREITEAANARAPEWEPNMEGRGALAGTLIKGARAVAPMIPAMGAAFLPGGQAIAPTVAATMFGTSAAQDTEDKLRQQGISDADATAAGWRTGMLQGPLEGVSALAGGAALRGLRPMFGGAAATTGAMASRMADDSVLKPLAKGMGLNLLVQPATEVAQDVGTELVERSYGATPGDLMDIAKDSAQGGLGLTLLLGPFAAGGQVARARRGAEIKQALYDPSTPENVRAQYRDLVVEAAAKDGVSAQDSDAWLDEQFAADDQRIAQQEARDAQYAQDQGQVLFDQDQARRLAQNEQDKSDIIELMQPQPMGAVTPSPMAATQTPAAVAQVMEQAQVAQAEREKQAQIQMMEAQAQKTPQQLAKEQAQAATVVLNQQAAIVAKQEGVDKVKGGVQVVKEMMRASDAISPELSGQIIGELQSGDVAAARKMVNEAVKIEKARQADIRKVAEANAAFQAEQDEFASKVAAKAPAAAPSPAPAPTPAPAPELTPGQKLVQGLEQKFGKKLHPRAKKRLYTLFGMDPDEGYIVSTPRTLDQVAAIEAAELGLKKPVSREAIRKSLAPFGINDEVMSRMAAFQEGSQTNETVEVDDDTTLSEAAPVDNTPETARGLEEEIAALHDAAGDDAPMRVRSNLGTSIVEPEMTPAQQRAETAANKMLGGTRGAAAQERKEAAVREATEAVITPEQAARNREILARNQNLIDEFNEEVERAVKLSELVPYTMQDQIERAEEDWAETRLEGDPAWADISVAHQAQWVRAFNAWDQGDMDTRQFNRVYEGIVNAETNEASAKQSGREAQQAGRAPDAGRSGPAGAEQPAGGRTGAPAADGEVRGEQGSDSAGDRAAINRHPLTQNSAFTRWFGDSKVVDDQGNPLVVYHGTPNDFTAFDAGRRGETTDLGFYGPGFYFANDPAVAGNYAKKRDSGQVMPVYLSMKNPYVTNEDVISEQERAELEANGHDGIISHFDKKNGYVEYVVFKPEQIKSAVGNRGTFDSSSPDIRQYRTASPLTTPDGQKVMVMDQTLADMERNPGIKEVFDHYRKNGIGHVLDIPQQWFIARGKTDFGGAYTVVDGKPSVIMSLQEMLRPANAAWTISHELGHAVDLAEEGGLYSGMPEFNVRLVGDEIRPIGGVMAEVVDHFENKGDKWFTETFQYPLDRKLHGDLDAEAIRQEVFAQLWATYNTRLGKEYLEDNLPDVAYFMEKVYEDVQQTQPSPEGKSGGTNEGAPRYSRFKQEAQARQDRQQGPRGAVEPVRFNRTQVEAAEKRGLTPLARETVDASQQFIKDLKSKALLWGSFTEDLANNIKDKLPSVTRYIELVKEAQVAKTRAERDVESVLDLYATLPAHERGTGPGSVNAYLKASTSEKKWGYKPDYLKKVTIDPAMSQRFTAMSQPAQELIKRVFKHGHDSLESLKAAVTGNISSEYDVLIAAAAKAGDKALAQKEMDNKAKELRNFQSLFAQSSEWPYAPLKRFGNHVVIGMSQAYLDAEKNGDQAALEKLQSNGDHYFVAFAETEREARKLKSQIEGQYAYADNFEKDGVQEQMYGGRDVLGAFTRLRKLVDNTQDDHLTKASRGALKRLMTDLHLSLLSEQSARQSERQRTGVAGADDDMMRAFATKGRATAHFIASLQNNGRIQDQLDAMEKEADARLPGREERRHAFNEMLRRHVMGLDYNPSPLVDKALSASSAWMLLTSPAYFLTNATQPFVMSLPTLAGKHGYGKSFAAMSKAYNDIFPLLKDGQLTQDDYSRMPADVRSVIEALADRGRIDITLEQDLGNWRSTEDSKLQSLGWAMGKLRGVTQTVESMNRIVTAIAAARLEQAAGATPEQQTNYAERVIFDTHGDYSGFNAPRVMRTGIGRLMTQFRKFQLIQISMYAKLLNQAFKGATPEQRLIGRRALAYNLIHMFALGGALALPGAQAIGFLLGAAFGDDDEPKNAELTLRKMVPPELADLFSKGVPKALGVDLSGRLGSGNMLSLLPFADTDVSRKGYEAAVMGALGPFLGGLLPKFADGLDMIGKGDYWKGSEQLLPKGFADLSKATRQATEGMSQRNGDTVMQPDEISLLATLSQAVGLPSTTLTERSFRASSKFKAEEHFKARSAQVKKEYTEAYRSGDQSALRDARKEWEHLQGVRKDYGYKPQPMSELLKAPQEKAKREKNTAGGVQFNRNNQGFVKELAAE